MKMSIRTAIIMALKKASKNRKNRFILYPDKCTIILVSFQLCEMKLKIKRNYENTDGYNSGLYRQFLDEHWGTDWDIINNGITISMNRAHKFLGESKGCEEFTTGLQKFISKKYSNTGFISFLQGKLNSN